jgi:putative ABC transport system permease protein
VLWKGLRVTVIGIGLVVAVAGARVLSAMLFEITAHDPLTFGTVVVSLALVAALACYIPARRASRVDPLIALREE